MKKLLMLFMCILTITFVSCDKEEENVLKLGFDADYPPYGYTQNGEYVGFDLEYAALVCEEIGYKLKLVPINWNAKDAELDAGTINCIWSGFTIEGREDLYEWTDAYCDNSIVIITTVSSGINALTDLAGKVLMTQADSSAKSALDSEEKAELVASLKNGKYIECDNYAEGIMELNTGAVDCIAIDINVAKYYLEKNPGMYKILDEALVKEQYGVGFKLGNTALRDLVNDAMNKVANEGKLDAIAEKYDLTDSVIIGK